MVKNKITPTGLKSIEKINSIDRFHLIVAALLTVLFHLSAVILMIIYTDQPLRQKPEFDILLQDENELEISRFVQTNPDIEKANEETNNIAAHSQKAQQVIEHQDEELVEVPNVGGEVEDSMDMFDAVDTIAQEPLVSTQVSVEQELSVEEVVDVADEPMSEEVGITLVENFKEAIREKTIPSPPSEPSPMPRPRVTDSMRTALSKPRGHSRMGRSITTSARFNHYGAYLEKMIERIRYQWYSLLTQSTLAASDMGTKVHISFQINKDGQVSNVTVLSTTAKALPTYLSEHAILLLDPLDPWNEEMIESLKKEEKIKIGFRY